MAVDLKRLKIDEANKRETSQKSNRPTLKRGLQLRMIRMSSSNYRYLIEHYHTMAIRTRSHQLRVWMIRFF